MEGTNAGAWGARARLRGRAKGGPPHARGEQRGNGQNGQEPDGNAHVFCLDAQEAIVADSGRIMEGALAARVFVGAKGSSSLPPRAQHRIWAGQIAALEGSEAILLFGLPGKNLRIFLSFSS